MKSAFLGCYTIKRLLLCASSFHRRGINPTLTPPSLEHVKVKFSCQIFPSGVSLHSNLSNCCTNRTSVYPTSVRAKFWPTHILGPPLKGRYDHPGRRLFSGSQRSGLKTIASGPYTDSSRCRLNVWYATMP